MVGRLGLVSSRDWAEAVAARFGFELVAADDLPREPLLADQLSLRFLRHASVLPVRVPGRAAAARHGRPRQQPTPSRPSVTLATGPRWCR